MRNQIFILLQSLLLLSFNPCLVYSQELPQLIISGTVLNIKTGAPVVNQEIYIATNGNPGIYQSVVTDSTGEYHAVIIPQSFQGYLIVYTYNCNNDVEKQILTYNTSTNFQIDFSLCPFSQKECQALFYYYYDTINPNLIHFFDSSISKLPVANRNWDFGDGNYSELQNPEHLFNDSGTYLVKLRVLTTDSCESFYSDTIKVTQSVLNWCNANFYAHLDTANGLSNVYKFYFNSNASSPIVQRLWDFDDGTTSTALNPVHQFVNYTASVDTFNVCLTIITLTSCTSTYCYSFFIQPNAACNAYFSYTADAVNQNLISFQNLSQVKTSIAYVQWYFGEGTYSSNYNPQHLFPYPGFYNVSLEITAIDSCKSIYEMPIKVGNPNYYTLFGQSFSGIYPLLDTGVAILYKTYPNNFIQAVDTMYFGELGCYYFFQLIEGHYKINIRPVAGSTYYMDLAPTYFTDKLHWHNAGHIVLTSNQFNADVHLKRLTSLAGQGSISGTVRRKTPGSNLEPAENIMIMLFQANAEPVRISYSSSNGGFSFPNIEAGTYTIYAEVAGKHTIPVSVTLNNANMYQSGIQLLIDSNTILGLSDKMKQQHFSANAFPIPANESVHIEVTSPLTQNVFFNIFGVNGQLFYSAKHFVNAGTSVIKLDIDNYSNGYFLLQLTPEKSGDSQYIKLIKSKQ